MHEGQVDQIRRDELLDALLRKASKISDDVKNWITAEAEPLFLSSVSSQPVNQRRIDYPDVISGVLDCVANTALLTIDNILRFLCHAKLLSSRFPDGSRQHHLEFSQLLDNQETIKQRHQRAMTAFEFVQGESELAAKPLDFGLRQIQSNGFSGPIDALDEREGDAAFGPNRGH